MRREYLTLVTVGLLLIFLSAAGKAYFSAASDLHSKQVKALLTAYSKFIREATEEEADQGWPKFTRNHSLQNWNVYISLSFRFSRERRYSLRWPSKGWYCGPCPSGWQERQGQEVWWQTQAI